MMEFLTTDKVSVLTLLVVAFACYQLGNINKTKSKNNDTKRTN